MKFPNLILAGVPKSGTSSVFRWLLDHPQVCGSNPKETFFLMDYDHPLAHPTNNYHQQGIEGYYSFFEHCSPSATVICEATTHYIYQQTAIDVLSQLSNPPQVIFILRQPEERIYSSYKFTLNNRSRLKVDLSFSEYINLLKNQSFDEFQTYFRHFGSAYILFHEIQYSCYVQYLEKWLTQFPKHKIHILFFEDLLNDKQQFMKKLSNIAGIDPNWYSQYNFPHYNESYSVKNKFFHNKVLSLSKWVNFFPFKEQLKNVYLSIQTQQKNRAKSGEDQETLNVLAEYFRDCNQRLSKLFNVDLSLWM